VATMGNESQPDTPAIPQGAEPQSTPQIRPAQVPNVDPGLLVEVTKGAPEAPETKVARPTEKR
jgi:hypothetical protein